MKIKSFDERRDLIILNSLEDAITFSTNQFIEIAQKAIDAKGKFFVALSGGSTPIAIYKKLSEPAYKDKLDWSAVHVFWSDERFVSHIHPESNFLSAFQAGLSFLPLNAANVHPIPTEGNPETCAKQYEELILNLVPQGRFDLIMLGMGDDGHTASLFPETHALHVTEKLVVSNFVPQKNTWRITFTYLCINQAFHTSIYVLGKGKSNMVNLALNGTYTPDLIPIQSIGTLEHKALWILDQESSKKLLS